MRKLETRAADISPDEVCVRFARRKTALVVKKLDRTTILIEGTKAGLEFLGALLVAQARFNKDCGFQLGPRSAGSTFFRKGSKFGLYIHRLCSKGAL